MGSREEQIDSAYSQTFEWIFPDRRCGFQDWMEGDGGTFRIKGKPGSGKSTLMKYALRDARTRQALSSRGRIILSMPAFFFHDRGVYQTQKSFQGLLRSTIYQLIEDIPALIFTIEGLYLQKAHLQEVMQANQSVLVSLVLLVLVVILGIRFRV